MAVIRKIYEDLPEQLNVPVELAHRRVEVLMVALDDATSQGRVASWLPGFFNSTSGQWQGELLQRAPQGSQASRSDMR